MDEEEFMSVVWYPGEPICTKTPIQKFQKMQKRINKMVQDGTFKNIEYGFTANLLNSIGRLTSSTKGCK